MNTSFHIVIAIILLSCFSSYTQAQPPIELRVNLAGYPSLMPKKVLILSHQNFKKPILLLKQENGDLVKKYPGIKSEHVWHPFSNYYTVDFSEVKEKGKYYFELQGEGVKSHTFQIGKSNFGSQ